MKSLFGFDAAGLASTIAATALVTTLSQPAWAAATRITGVEVKDAEGGIEVLLKQARPGDRPQVFSVERGSSWVADIINSELALPEGGGFQSMNPAPGIASVQVVPLDANSVRVIVTGEGGAPSGELTTRGTEGLAFSVKANGGGAAAPRTGAAPSTAASTPVAQRSGTTTPQANPEVLVPNPEITITGGQPTAIPRANPAPPFLPRAVAPPLGDIAVSDLSPQSTSIDLGTVERVPRLVLRDAPAREVLSLLARAAGLNLAFIGGGAGGAEGLAAAAGDEGPAVTLDIEGEPVQDVFNYVLRLTDLQAVRQGRTILVGPELPAQVQTQNTIVRTMRINQADADTVAAFLSAQGAETQRVVTQTNRIEEGTGVDKRVREETVTSIQPLAANTSATGAPLLLQGLSIVTDDRLNTVTLIGEPRLIELATSFTRQLDLRQRQVAVNVKVVDIQLDNQGSFSSGFSFGVDDSFIVSDGGAATIRFGSSAPATSQSLNQSYSNPPVIPYTTSDDFLGLYPKGFLQGAQGVQSPTQVDLSRDVTIPGLSSNDNQFNVTRVRISNTGARTTDSLGIIPLPPGSTLTDANGSVTIPGVIFLDSNPLSPSVTGSTNSSVITGSSITPGQLEFVDVDNNGLFTTGVDLIQRLIQPQGTVSQGLPQLYRFPTNFLASIQAQVVSGNAKILTDPTLVVQEGQSASVNLTAKVITNVTEVASTGDNARPAIQNEFEDVGLLLTIGVVRVDDNGFVTMEVQPRVSSAANTQQVQTSLGPFTVAQVSKRELNSGRIRLRDGQSLILAGIIQEQELESVTKWPILGDIPVIGALFRNTSSSKQRTEVVVVVTPQVMDDSDRAGFGYSYTPSPEAQQFIDRSR